MKLLTTALLLLLTGTAIAQEKDAAVKKPLSVCRVLADLQSYSGKLIEARGTLCVSFEIARLFAPRCDLPQPFEFRGAEWPLAITLGSARMARERGLRVPYENDEVSAAKLGELVGTLRSGDPEVCVEVTVSGILQTLPDYRPIIDSTGRKRGFGFGHFNMFVAEIAVKEYRDLGKRPPNR